MRVQTHPTHHRQQPLAAQEDERRSHRHPRHLPRSVLHGAGQDLLRPPIAVAVPSGLPAGDGAQEEVALTRRVSQRQYSLPPSNDDAGHFAANYRPLP